MTAKARKKAKSAEEKKPDRQLKVSVSMGLVGCRKTETIKISHEEASDPDELEEAAREALFSMIEWNYELVGESADTE